MTQKWPGTLQDQMYPIYIYVWLVSPSPKFQSVFPYDQSFLKYTAFQDKCIEWLQNDREPYKVKCTPYMCN